MSLHRLMSLVEGLDHSSPEGREDADAIRWLVTAHGEMLKALETLAGRLCGDSMSAQDRRDAYDIADAAISKAEARS